MLTRVALIKQGQNSGSLVNHYVNKVVNKAKNVYKMEEIAY